MSADAVAAVTGTAVIATVLLLAVLAQPRPRRPPPLRAAVEGSAGQGRRPSRPLLAGAVAALAVTATITAGPAAAAGAGALGGAYVLHRRRAVDRRRRRDIDEALPDAVELLVLCVHAGRSPHQAIAELAVRAPPAVREAFAAVEQGLHRGRSLADALGALGMHLGPAGDEVARAVAGADRDGLPLAPVLDQLASEARAARRRFGDVEARRLPVRLTFPLVCCTLPSFVLLTIAPAVLGALSTLRATAP
ncbi:MAG: type II secretion system F family protein [Ilumatobacteraceae bacterium]